jgi:hypothetical protein
MSFYTATTRQRSYLHSLKPSHDLDPIFADGFQLRKTSSAKSKTFWEERNQSLAQCLTSILHKMSPAVPLPIQAPTLTDDPLGITTVSDFYGPGSWVLRAPHIPDLNTAPLPRPQPAPHRLPLGHHRPHPPISLIPIYRTKCCRRRTPRALSAPHT